MRTKLLFVMLCLAVVIAGGFILIAGAEQETRERISGRGYDPLAGTWTEMVRDHPSGRSGHAMVYLEGHAKILLFGGWDGHNGLSDTWAYDYKTNTWTNMNPGTSPSARMYPGMAYDLKSDKVILFGGLGWSGVLSDTWAYDYNTNTWTNMNPSPYPSEREFHQLSYDPGSDRIILYGGTDFSNIFSDTWAYDYDTNTWTNRNPGANLGPRYGYAMTYQSVEGRVLLFGGMDNTGPKADTWLYDYQANAWKDVTPSTSPSAREWHAMAYDSKSGRVILFGGENHLSDTWAYQSGGGWTNMDPDPHPCGRHLHAMAYNSDEDKIILFGGQGSSGLLSDTWQYDYNTNTWTNLSMTGRTDHAMAYDSQSDRVILFGGRNDTQYFSETWAYDLNNNRWKFMDPATHPSPRRGTAMAYDSESDRVILFGGHSGSSYLSDTWAYDYNTNTWTNMNPSSPSPPGRYYHAMAYDSESDRVILFGGFNGGWLSDTWAYDYNTNTWTNMNPGTSPSGRYGHAMAYDSDDDRVILFGGFDGTHYFSDIWFYDFNSPGWIQSYCDTPAGRAWHAMAYDSQSRRTVLFGGYDGTSSLGDTWAYDFSYDRWEELTPSSSPSARYGHAMVYDSESDRVILFGGTGSILSDTWTYDYQPPVPWVPGVIALCASTVVMALFLRRRKNHSC